jgi:hypothetical protein
MVVGPLLRIKTPPPAARGRPRRPQTAESKYLIREATTPALAPYAHTVAAPISSPDEVTTALHALADEVRRLPCAVLTTDDADSDCWRIDPVTGEGLSVEWDDDGQLWIAIEVGDHQFSVLREVEAVDYVRDIVMAAIHGTITEVKAFGRAEIRIPRADGTVTRDAGYGFPFGLIPLPGWARRATPIEHPAYE